MYYVLYKMTSRNEKYIVTKIWDGLEFNCLMKVSFFTPLLITTSLELATTAQDNYNKKA